MIVPERPRSYLIQCAMCGEDFIAEKSVDGDFYCSDQCFLDSLAYPTAERSHGQWRRTLGGPMSYLRSLPSGTRGRRSRLEVLAEMREQAMGDPEILAWIEAQEAREKARLEDALSGHCPDCQSPKVAEHLARGNN